MEEAGLPSNEAGSSIMPGRGRSDAVEALSMVCCQTFGNITSITVVRSQSAWVPVWVDALPLENTQYFQTRVAEMDSAIIYSSAFGVGRGIVPRLRRTLAGDSDTLEIAER